MALVQEPQRQTDCRQALEQIEAWRRQKEQERQMKYEEQKQVSQLKKF